MQHVMEDGLRWGGGWGGSILHNNTVPGTDWVGLGRYMQSLHTSVFIWHTQTCVCVRVCVIVWAWRYTIQVVDSDIWMCWLSFGRQRSGDVYAAEKDDLMIDQLLILPPVLALFTSPSLSSPVAVLCLVLPHPPTHATLFASLTLFNKINIAHMATYCPLAAGAIKRSTWLHLFFQWIWAVPPLLSLCRIRWYMIKGAITVRQLLTLLRNLCWHNVL